MFTDLLGVAGLTILIMITPGADLALVTRNTLVGGKSAGGWTSAGILTGNLVHLTYCLQTWTHFRLHCSTPHRCEQLTHISVQRRTSRARTSRFVGKT